MAAETPPVIQVPTSKERRYDRQLRLWAANGQAALEDAHVLLINSGPGVAGVEALKNLVLPGVGHFTILDSALVTEADLGVNFFLEDSDLGALRAERCTKWLKELNPGVEGGHISEIPHAFPIVDTHPDPATIADLRLLAPWPELLDFARSMKPALNEMDDEQHGHVPWVVLILHYLQEWQSSREGRLPQNYKEKTEFRDLVRSGSRTDNAEGGEENFDEAIAAVLKSLNAGGPSSAVKEVLDAPECLQLTMDGSDFWLIARAVREFYGKHGCLPLPGSLPDMKAKSEVYIQLQTIYKNKARKDVTEVAQYVSRLCEETGHSPVDFREIESFCKNAGYIKVVRGRIPQFLKGDGFQFKDRAKSAAFLAYDKFAATHSLQAAQMVVNGVATQVPTSQTLFDDVSVAVAKVTSIAHAALDAVINEAGAYLEDPDYSTVKATLSNICADLVAAQGGELHNIAALTGGMVAQEAIKAITRQYVPIDNVCLYDGTRSRTSVLRL